MALVELRGIRKSFDLGGEPVEILHGVDLKVDKGEFVAMMGPSGSGKSTTMNILGCLDRPTSGEYLLNGASVEEMDSDELAHIRNSMIGFVFQGFNLLPKTTALENVELPLLYAGVPRAERHEKAKAALIEMGLEERLYHEPTQLSGGQQQRVAIARAIVLKPEFLLLDEPLSALDAKVRVKLRRELRRIQQKLGITTIMVTHDQEEALSLADRVIVMNNSVIEQIDTPQKVYESPRSPFVADFVGTVNFVGGRRGAIRPESLRLSGEASEDSIPGRICDIEFRGSFYRVGVETGGGEYTADVPAHQRERLPLRFGALVYLDIPAEKVICLKAS